MKVYIVMLHDTPQEVFLDKMEAHNWAENMYGCKADGICVDGVSVVAFESVV